MISEIHSKVLTLAIKSYLEKYGYSKELEQLLVKSYLYSGDYKGTIKAIEELSGVYAQTQKNLPRSFVSLWN